MCRLRTFAGPPIYHLPGNVTGLSVNVGLVYISVQYEYELPSSTRFGQFQKFEKFELGPLSSLAIPLRKKIRTGSEYLFIAT